MKIPVFQILTRTFVLNKFSMYFKYLDVIRGQYLFKQGDEANLVFIVCDG